MFFPVIVQYKIGMNIEIQDKNPSKYSGITINNLSIKFFMILF